LAPAFAGAFFINRTVPFLLLFLFFCTIIFPQAGLSIFNGVDDIFAINDNFGGSGGMARLKRFAGNEKILIFPVCVQRMRFFAWLCGRKFDRRKTWSTSA